MNINNELQSKEEMTQQYLERRPSWLEQALLMCACRQVAVSHCLRCWEEINSIQATPREERKLYAKERSRGERLSKKRSLRMSWGCTAGLLACLWSEPRIGPGEQQEGGKDEADSVNLTS